MNTKVCETESNEIVYLLCFAVFSSNENYREEENSDFSLIRQVIKIKKKRVFKGLMVLIFWFIFTTVKKSYRFI